MALNDNAPYSGEVQYGTVDSAVPGTVVNGGGWTVDPQVATTDGIGMRRVSHRSFYTGVFTYNVTHPVIAPLSAMIRTAAANSTTASACVAGNTDGEWTISSAQPSGFTAQCAVGGPLTANLGYWGIAAQSATGASQGAGSGVAAEATRFNVTVDGGDYYVRDWTVGLNTNPYWESYQNHSSASSAPAGVRLGVQDVTLRLGCAKQLPDGAPATGFSYTEDTHDADIDVVITCVDANDSAIIVFTLSDLCSPVEAGAYQVGGMTVNNYNFRTAKQLAALTVAAS